MPGQLRVRTQTEAHLSLGLVNRKWKTRQRGKKHYQPSMLSKEWKITVGSRRKVITLDGWLGEKQSESPRNRELRKGEGEQYNFFVQTQTYSICFKIKYELPVGGIHHHLLGREWGAGSTPNSVYTGDSNQYLKYYFLINGWLKSGFNIIYLNGLLFFFLAGFRENIVSMR